MKYFFANWKMYHTYKEATALIDEIKNTSTNDDVTSVYFPNDLAIMYAVKQLGSPHVGAQNVAWAPAGAYTGATSAFLYREAGVSYALVGHSERRYIFGETNDAVRKKMEACIDADVVPILCIGETKEDIDDDKREYRLKKQLYTALEDLDMQGKELFVAYEPVWAVGTGEPCSPQIVAEVADWIRAQVQEEFDTHVVKILYGGSIHKDNVSSYFSTGKIDGVLVGGASTKKHSLFPLLQQING